MANTAKTTENTPAGNKNPLNPAPEGYWLDWIERLYRSDRWSLDLHIFKEERRFITRVNYTLDSITSTDDLRIYYCVVKRLMRLFSDKTKLEIKNRFKERKKEIVG